MDAQLTLLLEIQDLRAQHRELTEGSILGTLEHDQFGIDTDEASSALNEKIRELSEQLDLPVRRRLDRIAGRLDRVVVPVIGGTCYGCFVAVAAETAGEGDPNALLHSCEHCGRFLYFLP